MGNYKNKRNKKNKQPTAFVDTLRDIKKLINVWNPLTPKLRK